MNTNYLKSTAAFEMYETDFVLWSEKTAQLIRNRLFDQVDWENVAEEIESLSRSDRRALRSQVKRVIVHMLKWHYEPERRTISWEVIIDDGRDQIQQLIKDSPSLIPTLLDIIQYCYPNAVRQASKETGLPQQKFPPSCPFDIHQLLGD